jgi:hypothetical protein
MLAAAATAQPSIGQTFAKRWRPASVLIRTVHAMTKRVPERRTALVTAAGIAAVVVAGTFAVGANVGILDASSDNEIGALTAAGDLVPTTAATPGPVTTGASTSTTATAQTYLVDVAGTVTVDATGGPLVVSAVDAAPGWTWIADPSASTPVELTFTDGVRSLVFSATRGSDGRIAASVTETTPDASVHATATTVSTSSDGDDRDDRDDRDDEDHADEGHDDEGHDDEHEGRDDDD